MLKYRLNCKEKIQAVNTWAVALVGYVTGIINWKVDQLKKNGRNGRKDFDNIWTSSSKE